MPQSCQLNVNAARARMAAVQLTQFNLALQCEIDVRTVQRWFAGHPVSRVNAERMAALLGVGTAELFTGVSSEGLFQASSRLRLLQRLLSTRDNALARGFRLTQEYFHTALQNVSFDAHPLHGFVSRHTVGSSAGHGFVPFAINTTASDVDIDVRCQLGRHFGYVVARIRLRAERAYLVEVWQTHAMIATRTASGDVTLWIWLGSEARELLFVSSAELRTAALRSPSTQTLALAEVGSEHVLCIRPNAAQLRSAGLPMGFDRLSGARENRVDCAVDWDALGEVPS